MPTLHELGLKHGTDKATYHGYCAFYEQHLPARHACSALLEVGVKDGASLRMWRDWYHLARVVGVDINPPLAIAGCTVLQMDATMPIVRELLPGPWDVIIDDGSHRTLDQQTTFELLWPTLRPGGWYVVEDIHTSWWPGYQNAPRNTHDVLRERFPDALLWSRFVNCDDSATLLIRKPGGTGGSPGGSPAHDGPR